MVATSPLLVSILRQGDVLLASINAALDDTEMVRFQEALVERIGEERCRGVIIDVAALDVLDSYGARTLSLLAEMARLLSGLPDSSSGLEHARELLELASSARRPATADTRS